MTNAIIAHLSSDTYTTALGITVRSPSPVLALCRQLVESSTYGSSTYGSAPLDACCAYGCAVSERPHR
jgi:hypothetical protein